MDTGRSNARGGAFSRGSVGEPIPMIEPFSGEPIPMIEPFSGERSFRAA